MRILGVALIVLGMSGVFLLNSVPLMLICMFVAFAGGALVGVAR